MIRKAMVLIGLCGIVGLFSNASAEAEENTQLAMVTVPKKAEETSPLKAGVPIPTAQLKTSSGASFDLNKAVAEKPTVLIFYRGGWCPYCNTHLGELKKIEPELIKLGYQVFGIAPDKPEKIKLSEQRFQANYTLLSDSSMELSKAFGLAFEVEQALVTKYKSEYGIDLEADSGETHHLLPVPSSYIVGTNGVIRYAYSNPDYKVRVDSNELLEAARLHK